jgi:hypothetical protein
MISVTGTTPSYGRSRCSVNEVLSNDMPSTRRTTTPTATPGSTATPTRTSSDNPAYRAKPRSGTYTEADRREFRAPARTHGQTTPTKTPSTKQPATTAPPTSTQQPQPTPVIRIHIGWPRRTSVVEIHRANRAVEMNALHSGTERRRRKCRNDARHRATDDRWIRPGRSRTTDNHEHDKQQEAPQDQALQLSRRAG